MNKTIQTDEQIRCVCGKTVDGTMIFSFSWRILNHEQTQAPEPGTKKGIPKEWHHLFTIGDYDKFIEKLSEAKTEAEKRYIEKINKQKEEKEKFIKELKKAIEESKANEK